MNISNFFETLASIDVQDDGAKSRKEILKAMTSVGKKFAIASIPASIFTLFPKTSSAQTGSETPMQVLQFALLLEQLEYAYYNNALNNSPGLVIPPADLPIFRQILKHETQHVAFLSATIASLSGTPGTAPTFDFSGNAAGANNNFTPFVVYGQFLALSQAFEDTGVRAYKGQAAFLQGSANKPYLQAALQIHSVEARHASEVRRLRGGGINVADNFDPGLTGWITGASYGTLPAATAAVYAGEDNTTQGGVNASTLGDGYGTNAATQAFDEPLTMAQVTAIASNFIQ